MGFRTCVGLGGSFSAPQPVRGGLGGGFGGLKAQDDERFATSYMGLTRTRKLGGPAQDSGLPASALNGLRTRQNVIFQDDRDRNAGEREPSLTREPSMTRAAGRSMGSASLAGSGLLSISRLSGSASESRLLHSGRGVSSPADGVTRLTRQQTMTRKEKRRSLLEALADPQVERRAKLTFDKFDVDRSGSIDQGELQSVLRELEDVLGMTMPSAAELEQEMRAHNKKQDGHLTFSEFFDLLVASMRRVVFDRHSMCDREFFVNKKQGSVWKIYERIKELGVGSFGSAYLAKSKVTHEERVVKAVKKGRAKIPVEDIEKEIMVMRQVDHPHIVRLFEWYEDTSRIYLILEALTGGTLREIILDFQKTRRNLREDWIRTVVRQSLEALAYVHGLRLIHKDIKDENIMLLRKDPQFRNPHAVIIDLGIAEMFTPSDPQGHECGGTPVTMAPEVWKGTFGPKCDVWSMGCVLFELLAGTMPFLSNSVDAKVWLRLIKKGADWSKIRISPLGTDLCKRMITYKEESRPTISECRQHDWFASGDEGQEVLPEQFLPLKKFCEQASLKRSLLLELASRLPMGKAGQILKFFEAVDADRDGCVSPEELMDFLQRAGLEERETKRIWRALDADGDGFLTFSEFAAGMLFVFRDLLEERLRARFMEHDTNSDGFLDREETGRFLSDATLLLTGKSASNRSTRLLNELIPPGQDKVGFEGLKSVLLGETNKNSAR